MLISCVFWNYFLLIFAILINILRIKPWFVLGITMRKLVVLFVVVCMVLPHVMQAQLKGKIEAQMAIVHYRINSKVADFPAAMPLLIRAEQVMERLKVLEDNRDNLKEIRQLGRSGAVVAGEANIFFNRVAKTVENFILQLQAKEVAQVLGRTKIRLFNLLH